MGSGSLSKSASASSGDVLESVASTGGSMSVLLSSDEAFEFECDHCIKTGKHREAKTFCSECKNYFCGSCKDTHSRFPALRNHKIVTTEDMKKVCGLCNTGGKHEEARYFCKECNSWICDDCKKSHEKFQDLQKHTFVSIKAIFQAYSNTRPDKVISVQLGQLSTKSSGRGVFSDASSNTKSQNYGENQTPNVPTRPRMAIATPNVLTKTSTDFPAVQHVNILRYKTINKVKEIKVKVSHDRDNCRIMGCCFMPGGELVLCDWENDKIKLLDRSLSVVDSLDLPGVPCDVAAVDCSNVIVTMPWKLQFQFIEVLPSLKTGRTIDVGMHCPGVAVAAGKIFVSCYSDDDEVAEIRVYDLEGRDLGKRLGINPDGSNMFRSPDYVAVSRSGVKIFVSDWDSYTVSCVTSNGTIVYEYRDDELRSPRGLFVDDNDNVVVCGYFSDAVQVLTSAGKKHKTLLSQKDGISYPRCVSFRPSDGTLVVGCYDDKLLVYKMS